ncbi:uncharacterized protein LOC117583452 [Drosophila guanche]|uniref:Uncharacterized protein n=1 Tax=Drosophila guanche TaxID=7266 RepID=A0A3B0JDD9_DROGU|nr:uncharacterized protein LOC117583452 [Drosophila guanche]SPP80085.1 Hypothetical predicted protein [Drosophila guanche]
MGEEAYGTPLSGRRPRIGMSRRLCNTTPLLRMQREDVGATTPSHQTQETPRALPLTTNCRKRIGLSRIRTELTKKRLEFATASVLKENELIPKATENTPCINPEKKEYAVDKKTKEDERKEEEYKEDTVDEEEPQDSRIPELQADIVTWRRGFRVTVDALQDMIIPRPTKKNLLIHLRIPLEMLRYLEED